MWIQLGCSTILEDSRRSLIAGGRWLVDAARTVHEHELVELQTVVFHREHDLVIAWRRNVDEGALGGRGISPHAASPGPDAVGRVELHLTSFRPGVVDSYIGCIILLAG